MPPRTNFEAYRDEIYFRRETREPIDRTLLFLNDLIVADGGTAIGFRTLQRQLSTPSHSFITSTN